jgi:hypothetical protein
MRNLVLGLVLAVFGVAFAEDPPKPTPRLSPPAKIEAAKKEELPKVVVYKSESCGCCLGWVRHMEAAGFKVEVHNQDNMDPIKQALGIPPKLGSCHTAKVDRYYIEGHVPAEDVKKLLAEKPLAAGIAVPRMPIGSPGMEQGNYREPYDVLLVERNGKTTVYASHGK